MEGVETYGASVRGPRNSRDSRANQDAWTRSNGAFGDLIGVCDGLGSRPSSDAGAQAACRALRRAARLWRASACAAAGLDSTYLVRLVEILWLIEVASESPAECASTCMFALREPEGRLLLAGARRRNRHSSQCARGCGDVRRANSRCLRRRDVGAGSASSSERLVDRNRPAR